MIVDKFLKKPPKPVKTEHFFIFIESPIKVVAPQIFLWGQANWWPERSKIKAVNFPEGELRVGNKSVMTIKGILPAKFQSEISNIVPDRLIERTFIKGLLKGTETVSVEERYNGTRLDVKLQARPRNIIFGLLWSAFYSKIYINGMRNLLEQIKSYCLSVQRL